MVCYGKDGVIPLTGGEFSDEVHGDCSEWKVCVFWGDRLCGYFWPVGLRFGTLTYSASFYVVGYVCSKVGPPVVFGDGIRGLLCSGVASSGCVVIKRKHPPLKFIVFWDNKL